MTLPRLLALYNAALPLGLAWMLPGALVKLKRRGGRLRDFPQRLGFHDMETQRRLAQMERPLWLHAVSVGEAGVARKIIAALLARDPALPIVLTVTTTTGLSVARRGLPPQALALYSPVDTPGSIRRFLEAVRPRELILVESELWPNLLSIAKNWGLRLTLANARLSPRSERRYMKVRALIQPLLGLLDRVLVPDDGDPARWAALGAAPAALRVVGNVKHDFTGQAEDPRVPAFRTLLEGLFGTPLPPFLLAASTHDGEEAALGRIVQDLRREHPRLAFLCVPRHFERAAAVCADLARLGLRVARRSRLHEAPAQPDVLVIDTTGELRAWQSLADVVVIGKSFLSRGGQNPAEAAAAGRPVIMGPHMENFGPLVEDLLAAGGATQVTGLEALAPACSRLLADPAQAASIAAAGLAALARHQGSAARTAALLRG